MKTFFLTLLLCVIILPVRADHIVGGFINMEQKSAKQGDYRFTLGIYFNSSNFQNNEEALVTTEDYYLRIYRKRDNQEEATLQVFYKEYKKMIYSNPSCQQILNLNTRLYYFVGDQQLDKNQYNDSDGYYVAFERCCRERSLVNIENPGQTGMVFYTEFPSLKDYPTYSSPVFEMMSGDFACNSFPFQNKITVKDKDNDELRFSLVTPVKGSKTPQTAKDYTTPGPYKLIDWKDPYSINRVIWGIESLTIDSLSGVFRFQTGFDGKFAVTFRIDKIRNGKKIGFTLLDYQLVIAPCVLKSPDDPVITLNNKPIYSLELCEGEEVTVIAGDYNDVSYQWYRDGQLLDGEVSNRMVIDTTGSFYVVKNFATICGVPVNSDTLNSKLISESKPNIRLISSSKCLGDSVYLTVNKNSNQTYNWQVNTTSIQNKDTILVRNNANIKVYGVGKNGGCQSKSDTISIRFEALPTISFVPNSLYTLCKNDSIKLSTTTSQNISFTWYKNDSVFSKQSDVWLKNEGTYYLAAQNNQNHCKNQTNRFDLTITDRPSITFNIKDSVCLNSGILPLQATPTGGKFSGDFVNNATFNIEKAKAGEHPIFYEIGLAGGSCSAKDTFRLFVMPTLAFSLPDEVFAKPNEPFAIPLSIPDGSYTFQWSPQVGLDNPNIKNPLATVPDNTIYKVQITDLAGCVYQDSILLKVFFAVIIPNAFTPNGDGLNELWKIDGLEVYPDLEVFIYNSLGEEIFYSKGYKAPWDGTFKGERVPVGYYIYTINTNKNNVRFQGILHIID